MRPSPASPIDPPRRSRYQTLLDAAENGLQEANAALYEGSRGLRECGNDQLEQLGREIDVLRVKVGCLRDRIPVLRKM